MRIHVVEPMRLTPEQKTRLGKLGDIKYSKETPGIDALLKRSVGADILCVDWAPIDAAIPKMKPGIKLISVPYSGTGFLPLNEAAKKGIKIANAPGYSTESVGEFGIGLMLALVRKMPLYAIGRPNSDIATCLYGKTIGILGYGRIGRYVGKIAKSFGMKVLPWRRGEALSKVLRTSDIIYCALPLTKETKGLIGKKEFALMKKGSYFVTTSHNLIYNHKALLDALDENLSGAAMDLEGTTAGDCKSDVYQKFKNHQRILVTPHIAFKTDYAIKRGYDMMIDNIAAFVKGKPINIVN